MRLSLINTDEQCSLHFSFSGTLPSLSLSAKLNNNVLHILTYMERYSVQSTRVS